MGRIAAVVLLALWAGCGGGGDDDVPGDDGGGMTLDGDLPVVDGAMADRIDSSLVVPDAAMCSTLPATTPVVGTMAAGTAPTPAGGTIADGTYKLTTVERFGGSGTVGTFADTLKFLSGATRFERVIRAPGATEDANTSGTASQSGTMLSLAETCGGTGRPNIPYTATATNLKSIVSLGGPTFVFTYVKQ